VIWLAMLLAALLMSAAPIRPERGSAEGVRTHTIEISNFAFSPARLEVAVGDTVLWVNRDAAPHTATDSAGRWASGELKASSRWSRVMGKPGRLPYICEYHPPMRGELIVRGSR
jgi:plastocyanin